MKCQLVGKNTGLLIVTYTYDGEPHPAGYRPEGTTTWVANHMLQVINPEFAQVAFPREDETHLTYEMAGAIGNPYFSIVC